MRISSPSSIVLSPWKNGFAVVVLLLLIASCHSGNEVTTTNVPSDTTARVAVAQPSKYLIQGKDTFMRAVDTFAVGDINGDGKADTAYVIGPFFRHDECKDTCITAITFSSGIPPLKLGNSIGGTVYEQADVTGDGRGEILFIPDWFQSCWSGLFAYSLKGNAWVKLGEASVYSCADDVHLNRIRKAGNGFIEMVDDSMDEEGKMLKVAHKVKL